MSHDISIILVNHNGKQLTDACLASLSKLDNKSGAVHVVIVDNGSSKPYTLPRRLSGLDILLIRSESNLGFTGGNNMGIHAAVERYNSDYILLLNNDTEVRHDALDLLVEWAEAHPAQGVVCSKIYFAPGMEYHSKSYTKAERGMVLWYAGGSIDWNNLDTHHRGVDEVDRGQFATQTASEFGTGCCFLIKREVLEKIGLLDKRYFLYYEDADWSQRVKQFGYEIGYCDAAVVWHLNAGSSGGAGSHVQHYYQTRNRLFFFWRWGSLRVKARVLRVAFEYLLHGDIMQRKAVLHALTGRFGKQPLS